MRAALLLLLTLAGCGERRDFDSRYDETAQTILDRANAIDANVAAALDEGTPPPAGNGP